MVREMGLEPTRKYHTHLKRACLPFQHSRICSSIIAVPGAVVNLFLPDRVGFLRVPARDGVLFGSWEIFEKSLD